MENYTGYEGYIKQIKGVSAPLDAERMKARIEAGIDRRVRSARLILAGAFAIFLIGAAGYFFGNVYLAGGNETLAEYVLQQKDSNADPIMGYVLAGQ